MTFETDLSFNPSYALRAYAWAVLQANDAATWDETKYGGLVPIVPLADEPDLSQFAGPKIIYEYTLLDKGATHYRGRGSMAFGIKDPNYRRLTRTMNILEAAFGRLDESAADINKFVSQENSPLFGQVGFGYTSVSFSDGGTPEDTEGGNQMGVIAIDYDYFVDYSIITDVVT